MNSDRTAPFILGIPTCSQCSSGKPTGYTGSRDPSTTCCSTNSLPSARFVSIYLCHVTMCNMLQCLQKIYSLYIECSRNDISFVPNFDLSDEFDHTIRMLPLALGRNDGNGKQKCTRTLTRKFLTSYFRSDTVTNITNYIYATQCCPTFQRRKAQR